MSISSEIGCAPQTLNDLVKKVEADGGKRLGVSSELTLCIKALGRDNRAPRQA